MHTWHQQIPLWNLCQQRLAGPKECRAEAWMDARMAGNGSETDSSTLEHPLTPPSSPHSPRLGTNGLLSLALFLSQVSPSGCRGGRWPGAAFLPLTLKSGERKERNGSNPWMDVKSKNKWSRVRPLRLGGLFIGSGSSHLLNSAGVLLATSFPPGIPVVQPSQSVISSLSCITAEAVWFVVTPSVSSPPSDPIHLGILQTLHGSTTTTTGVHFGCLAASNKATVNT
ncbi:hypothetical protein B0T13DRAFT_465450 [Neurospora crassa]|nr:hypothetical protein B0T13DRAFT_484410 [Neurospora crassa]KAK3502086.1 hypothetical protein B0T13DRAFT_465450 [Neurospora crassa]